ncbi:UNVERIFIED_CONTAM: hypothetical protein FKN15_059056 [Acipenser sinensis]
MDDNPPGERLHRYSIEDGYLLTGQILSGSCKSIASEMPHLWTLHSVFSYKQG